MATHTQNVDGSQDQDINAQENALNWAEQTSFAYTVQYAKKSGAGTTNQAVLQDVPMGTPMHPLYLGDTAPNGDASSIPLRQPGLKQVFEGIAYVSGQERKVAGFRQP